MSKTAQARTVQYFIIFSLVVFCLAAVLLGEIFNAYEALWWWDDMLHLVSGVLIGVIGLLTIYFFNAKYNMAISPLFAAVFVFCFAMTVGVVWEVFEFSMDYFFATTMQQWNVAADAIVIGKEYQGIGLRDTMADLMLASIGALAAAAFAFYAYKHKKSLVMSVMRRTFPWVSETQK